MFLQLMGFKNWTLLKYNFKSIRKRSYIVNVIFIYSFVHSLSKQIGIHLPEVACPHIIWIT